MKPTIRTLLLIYTAIAAIFYYLFSTNVLDRCEIYEKCFRHYIFTSFLGIGSFVFALMTAILFNMKDKVYTDNNYIAIFKNSESGKTGTISIYLPLIDIGNLFIFTVFCCLASSVLQITFGLIRHDIAASFCMSSALTTLLIIFYVVYKVKRTMQAWFNILSDQILPEESTKK